MAIPPCPADSPATCPQPTSHPTPPHTRHGHSCSVLSVVVLYVCACVWNCSRQNSLPRPHCPIPSTGKGGGDCSMLRRYSEGKTPPCCWSVLCWSVRDRHRPSRAAKHPLPLLFHFPHTCPTAVVLGAHKQLMMRRVRVGIREWG